MLKKVFAVLFFLVSPALASVDLRESVTLDTKLELNGKQVASPRMTVQFGKKGTIAKQASGDSSSYSIEVEPTKQAKNLVALKIVVTQMKDDISTVLFTTKASTEIGRPAEVTRKQVGLQDLKLSITPTP